MEQQTTRDPRPAPSTKETHAIVQVDRVADVEVVRVAAFAEHRAEGYVEKTLSMHKRQTNRTATRRERQPALHMFIVPTLCERHWHFGKERRNCLPSRRINNYVREAICDNMPPNPSYLLVVHVEGAASDRSGDVNDQG